MQLIDFFKNPYANDILLTVAVVAFGFLTNKYSNKYKEVKGLIKALNEGLEDNNLTKKEIRRIINEAKDIL